LTDGQFFKPNAAATDQSFVFGTIPSGNPYNSWTISLTEWGNVGPNVTLAGANGTTVTGATSVALTAIVQPNELAVLSFNVGYNGIVSLTTAGSPWTTVDEVQNGASGQIAGTSTQFITSAGGASATTSWTGGSFNACQQIGRLSMPAASGADSGTPPDAGTTLPDGGTAVFLSDGGMALLVPDGGLALVLSDGGLLPIGGGSPLHLDVGFACGSSGSPSALAALMAGALLLLGRRRG
jgi:uncharacterized protein (TIGR03382 family)